jgi:regulator of cell morphogenesis and NO signaling
MNASEWIDDIVKTHHAYLKKELPELAELIQAPREKIGKEIEWEHLAKAFLDLKQELQTHILKEEVMLFPSILHIEAAVRANEKPDLKRHDIRESLEQAEYEHDATEQFLEDIFDAVSKIGRRPENKALFERLENLRKDLEEHIHKEENGFFPEARCLYAKATEGMLREE